jgi:predicted kinase
VGATLFLVQMAGMSGVGKSTLARRLADYLRAVVLDYDLVKSAALDAGAAWELAGGVGYRASHALADAILHQGNSVILDSPCRFQQLVDVGTSIASRRGATYAFIECILADENELRRRMSIRPRHRSQRRAFDIPPPDAPNDVMRDEAGQIRIPQSKVPASPWLQIDMSQSLDSCLANAQAYLARLDAKNAEYSGMPTAPHVPGA